MKKHHLLLIAGTILGSLALTTTSVSANKYRDITELDYLGQKTPVGYLNSKSVIWNYPYKTRKNTHIVYKMSNYQYRTFYAKKEAYVRNSSPWYYISYKKIHGWVKISTIHQGYARGSVEARKDAKKKMETALDYFWKVYENNHYSESTVEQAVTTLAKYRDLYVSERTLAGIPTNEEDIPLSEANTALSYWQR